MWKRDDLLEIRTTFWLGDLKTVWKRLKDAGDGVDKETGEEGRWLMERRHPSERHNDR